MQNVNREAVEELLAINNPSPAVTIYLPMHTTASPPHMSENQIRFKNLIHKAVGQLDAHGMDKQLAEELESTLSDHYNDLNFWEHQAPGLLVCARPGVMKMLRMPVDTEEYVAVDDSFHLAPVLAMLHEMPTYYVLSISQHNPHLFKGDRYGLYPSGIELPASVQAALQIDEDNQKSENQGSATGPSTNTGWFNGRGGARNPEEADRHNFLRRIDNIVHNSADRSMPIILAGISAEIAEYRTVNKHPKILEGTIHGSFAHAKPEELFKHAWEIIEQEIIIPERTAAINEYNRIEGANPDRTARDRQAIIQAAEQGRVDKLLAMMGRYTSDTIRDTTKAVAKITFPEPEVSKSINQLSIKVWQASGSIFNLTPSEMPHGANMVARLRY